MKENNIIILNTSYSMEQRNNDTERKKQTDEEIQRRERNTYRKETKEVEIDKDNEMKRQRDREGNIEMRK